MRSRIKTVVLWLFGIAIAVPVLLAAAVLAVLLTAAGQRFIETTAHDLTGGMVTLDGLSIALPGEFRASRLVVADRQGPWLTLEDAAISWSPGPLLSRTVLLRDIHAARIAVSRLPVSETTTQSTGGGQASLPVKLDLQALHIARLELGAPVAGHAAVLAIGGAARLDSLTAGTAKLDIRRQDSPGAYRLDASFDGTRAHAVLALEEPEGGLIATLAALPQLGALKADATLDGPLDAIATKATLAAGPLAATISGQVNATGQAVALDVAGTAPAMSPRPDLHWQSVQLNAHVEGTQADPHGTATLRVAGLEGFGTALSAVTADLALQDKRIHLDATLDGLRAPQVTTFADSPIRIGIDGPLDGALDFSLTHRLVALKGTARQDGSADASLTLPDLAPFAALGNVAAAGSAQTDAKLHYKDGTLSVDAAGHVALTAAPDPARALLAPQADFKATLTQHGNDIDISAFDLSAPKLTVHAQGGMKSNITQAQWHITLPDLAVLAPTAPGIAGRLLVDGTASGPSDDLSIQANFSGDLAAAGTRSPLTAKVDLHGLPQKPAGTVEAGGAFDGAPLALSLALARAETGTITFDLSKLSWKSAQGSGHLVWQPGAILPQGQMNIAMARLADAGHALGKPLAGALDAHANFDTTHAQLDLKLADAGLPGTATVKTTTLTATVQDPMGARALDAKLAVAGLAAGGMTTSLDLAAQGPPNRIGLKLSANTVTAGAPLALATAGTLDALGKKLDLASLQANWRGETLALAGPTHIDASNGLTVDRLALRLRDATLELAGRLQPALDLTASLKNLPVDLVRVVMPDAKAEGRVQASARLTGPPAAPSGTISLAATGLRWREGLAGTIKPGSVTVNATLAGASARLDAKAEAGDTNIAIAGTAPLAATGVMDLRLTGRSGLAAIDPLMAAAGRRVRGNVTLDATIQGTAAAPRLGGTLRLANGEVQDSSLGVRITDLAAELAGANDSVRLSRLTGKAGSGSIEAQGSFGLAQPMPVQMSLRMHQARLLNSSLVSGPMDADLSVSGSLAERLAAAGTITLGRTDITVPKSMPPSVAVLDVRRPGQKPPPPAAPPLPIALDITLRAPGELFLRGRGIDAELQGQLHVGGEAAAPRPSGAFTLRRGSFTLAGQVLQFVEGEVSLDGGLPIDPTLNFKASSTATGSAGTIVATVAITGHASKPKITLSSVPELPQDEVLAQLLFNRSASSLGPVELAQLASALAELSGATSGPSPLERMRSALGLDRLSVGAGGGGSAAAVQAGRTIAPGVYLGAKQNANGNGTQATVEVDLYKGLKLHADVGAGGATDATGSGSSSNGTGVGLSYQFEY